MKKKHYIILLGLIIAAGFAFSRNLLPLVWAEPAPEQISSKVKTVKHKETNIYTKAYQKETDQQLAKWKTKQKYTVKDPLLVMNPYGTNTGALYFYGTSSKEVTVKCTVRAEGKDDYSYTLKNNSGKKDEQEFLITGLVPGKTNQVVLTFYDKNQNIYYKEAFRVTTAADSEIPAVSSLNSGSGTTKLSNGLFAMLGHDKTDNANIYLYDNSGTIRG